MTKKMLAVFILGWGLALLTSGCRNASEALPAAEDREASGQTIRLDADGADAAGIKTARVETRSFSVPIQAFGVVQFDPHFHYHLTARVPGRVEEVFAFEGSAVAAGQKLLTLYSPDFLSAQSEYLQMLERQKAAERTGDAQERGLIQGMLQAAEKKLRFLGLSPEEVQALKEKRETALLLTVRAPIPGIISDCPAVAGSAVEAGTLLMEISDLRTVWVEARVFEKDIARLQPGLKAEVRLAALPGEKFPGRLTVIGAALDEASRTAKAIVEVANPARRLRAGMSAEMTLEPLQSTKFLVVPEAALRKVEGKDMVFVAGPGRTFTGREVKVGRTVEGFVEIVSGLSEGQEVVTAGSLALKSELLKKNLEGE